MNSIRSCITAVCVAALAAGCSSGRSAAPFAYPAGATQNPLNKASSGTITEYAIPRGHRGPVKTFPVGITLGPDGKMWFAERGLGKLRSITTDGQFGHAIELTGQAPYPQNSVAGPDGNLWATAGSTRTYKQESHGVPDPYGAIVMVTLAGVVTPYPLPMYSDPRAIVSGPDGNLWFTQSSGFIGRITPAGVITQFPIPRHRKSTGITVGPDGNMWFCMTYSDRLGQITTAGEITMFRFPAGGCAGIVTGPDGNLWATEFIRHRVAKIDTSGNVITEVELMRHSYPKGIAVGGDGNLYVAEFGKGNIAEVSTAAVLIAEKSTPTHDSGPWGVAADSDGNIWFAESLQARIGKLTVSVNK
jgi:streptogramin lyase